MSETVAVRRPSSFVLLLDSAMFALGVLIALGGMLFALAAVIAFVLLRSKMNWYEYEDFPLTVTMFTAMNVPLALLLLSVGWALSRRGARRFVSPVTRAGIQAVLVRGLGALLLLPVPLVAIAWFYDRSHIDTQALEPERWGYRFAVFFGLAAVSCLLGAFAQLLRPPRIGPFLFGAALVLGATVVFQFAQSLSWFYMAWACGIALVLTAPWRRLTRWR